MSNHVQIQKTYYEQTASNYDNVHIETEGNEHNFALRFLSSIIKFYGINSILDIGAGTGRTIEFLKKIYPNIRIIGIEPVEGLRKVAFSKGISNEILIDGDGNALQFKDNEFDLVCEFGVLHHVPNPNKVISEMLRVSKIGIFISDSNNFGQGSYIIRLIKQSINLLGLWKFYRFIKTKGKMYEISEGDGLFYSYSVFNNYSQIKKECKRVHLLNTIDGNNNLYRSASHIALLGIKKEVNNKKLGFLIK